MSGFALLASFSRLSLHLHTQQNIRTISTFNPLLFRATQCLWAEPMRKKKKLDPMIVKQREERKRRKIEKQIRRLEKNALQLKPLEEIEPPHILVDQGNKRARPAVVLTPEEQESRVLLEKDWTRYATQKLADDFQVVDRMARSQKKALDALYEVSEELYEQAIQPDLSLIPFKARGPVATRPIKNYDSPDGEYVDVSKKWI